MSFVGAVGGGSGSGKTTFVRNLAEHYGKNCIVIPVDMFYRCRKGLSREQIEAINFDHPDAIEYSLLKEVLLKLKKGESVEMPQYDFTTSTRKESVLIKPAPIIIVEGINVLQAKEIEKLFDIKIFVDATEEECFERRKRRDVGERGRELERVREQFKIVNIQAIAGCQPTLA